MTPEESRERQARLQRERRARRKECGEPVPRGSNKRAKPDNSAERARRYRARKKLALTINNH